MGHAVERFMAGFLQPMGIYPRPLNGGEMGQ
jgi:hypothetical protein